MRPHLRVIALVLAASLGLPFVIGTVVIIRNSLDGDGSLPASALPAIAPFGRIGFRVDDEVGRRCALLAATDAAHSQGMQGMAELRGYDAMVFAFAEDTSTAFINHFVPIDLSIGWYDADGRLVDHTTMAACPEGKNCPLYASKGSFRYAVETPSGGLEEMSLTEPGATLHVGGVCS